MNTATIIMDNPVTMMRETWVKIRSASSKMGEVPAAIYMTSKEFRNKEDAPWGWYPWSPMSNPYEEAERAANAAEVSEVAL